MKKGYKLIFLALAAAYFLHCSISPTAWHFIDNVNLIFHEAGHWIFALFGQFLYVLGGSLTQILIPFIISAYFFSRGQTFSGWIILLWAGQSFINVSVYAGDAIAMKLPLLGGDISTHDWNWLLTYLGYLKQTAIIAQYINIAGWILITTGLVGSIYNIYFEENAKEKIIVNR